MALGALLFAALGPAIGAAVTLTALIAAQSGPDKSFLEVAGTQLVLFFLSLLFAYPLGILPSAITGACAGWLRHRLRAPGAWLGIGGLGAAVSVAWMALVRNAQQFASEVWVHALAGFVAGAVCAWLLGRLRRRPSPDEAPAAPASTGT
jgi:hypothetical protein